MSFWFSARRATAYTRTAKSNEKGQVSRVTPGLTQRLRKTHKRHKRGGQPEAAPAAAAEEDEAPAPVAPVKKKKTARH